jgi:pyrroline-5-carboxylate reductase
MEKPNIHNKLALVGCGNMGSALLKGWLSLPYFKSLWVIAPHRDKVEPFLKDVRVQWFPSPQELPEAPDLIVFAVKPFILKDVLLLYQTFDSLMISVAAGKPLSFYEDYLPKQPIIRMMPNLAVEIHQGVMGFLANQHVTDTHKAMIKTCFQDLGFCPWVKTDEDLDKLTAISGSGPAYVFYFLDALMSAAEDLGFEKQLAFDLALHTFVGSSLYAQISGISPALLSSQVATPKGTTAAALKVFESGQLKEHVEKAVKAAFERAQELAHEK